MILPRHAILLRITSDTSLGVIDLRLHQLETLDNYDYETLDDYDRKTLDIRNP